MGTRPAKARESGRSAWIATLEVNCWESSWASRDRDGATNELASRPRDEPIETTSEIRDELCRRDQDREMWVRVSVSGEHERKYSDGPGLGLECEFERLEATICLNDVKMRLKTV